MRARIRRTVESQELREGIAGGLFWAWNLIFLAFMSLGFAPNLLPEILRAVREEDLPATMMAWALVLAGIPAMAALVGFFSRLRGQPNRLFALGYGVEAPLMLLVGARFFALRSLSPGILLLVGMAVLGLSTYLWWLLDGQSGMRGAGLEMLRFAGLCLLLVTGLYTAAWLSFYALPIAVGMAEVAGDLLHDWRFILEGMWTSLVHFRWPDLNEVRWLELPLYLFGAPLFGLTAFLAAAMPMVISLLYLRAWWASGRALSERRGRRLPALLAGTSLLLLALGFRWAADQPQHRAFALLEDRPADLEEAQALLERSESIRQGLLNAYLAPQRYVSARGEVRHVADMYRNGSIGLTEDGAERVRELYEGLASPLLYQPVGDYAGREEGRWNNLAFAEEPARAAERYAAFFDQPIVEAERPRIVRAVQTTWNVERARGARLEIDDREVHLERQSLRLREQVDWAELELHEVYRNQTWQRQELIYWFHLPESAVLTGLWLGGSEDPADRYDFRVAPRGAAQQLYREEVRRQVDPALLEQIGPRQYRLRVFPIEPRGWRWDPESGRQHQEPAPPMHLWLRYAVMAKGAADGSAHWPLPRLAELRNLYWDAETEHSYQGVEVFRDAEDPWLPASLPASTPVRPTSHRFDLPDGRSVVARPALPEELRPEAQSLRLDLVVDSSRSMEALAGRLGESIDRLREFVGGDGRVDVHLTRSSYSGLAPERLDLDAFVPEDLLYFGGQNASELLLQYGQLAADAAPDAVLVLTDGSGYELGASPSKVPIPDAPLWLIHLDGQLPLGYDDGTLAAIQASGGGVAGSVDEALARIVVARRSAAGEQSRDLVDGYVWSVMPTRELAGSVDRLPSEVEARETDEEGSRPLASSEATMQESSLPDAGSNSATGDATSAGFAALAARRWVLAEMQAARGMLDQLSSLDALHAIATERAIVTPYSSMIVLVDARQHRRLDGLEADPGRFERELEAVGETAEAPVAVTGVPEPEEWALLALAAVLLLWSRRGGLGGPIEPAFRA